MLPACQVYCSVSNTECYNQTVNNTHYPWAFSCSKVIRLIASSDSHKMVCLFLFLVHGLVILVRLEMLSQKMQLYANNTLKDKELNNPVVSVLLKSTWYVKAHEFMHHSKITPTHIFFLVEEGKYMTWQDVLMGREMNLFLDHLMVGHKQTVPLLGWMEAPVHPFSFTLCAALVAVEEKLIIGGCF